MSYSATANPLGRFPVLNKTGSALSKHRMVIADTANGRNAVALPGSSPGTKRVIGFLENDIADDNTGSMFQGGKVRIVAGSGGLSAGDPFTTDAAGKAVAIVSTELSHGVALEALSEDEVGEAYMFGPAPAPAGAIYTASKAVAFDDLAAAAGAESIAFDAALPAGALVIGASIDVTTGFTDGVAGVFTADMGIEGAGDQDALIDGADIASIAEVGSPLGVRPTGHYGGITPEVTILATVNVDTATAGALTAKVFYVLP